MAIPELVQESVGWKVLLQTALPNVSADNEFIFNNAAGAEEIEPVHISDEKRLLNSKRIFSPNVSTIGFFIFIFHFNIQKLQRLIPL
jgi:hypothetical protein